MDLNFFMEYIERKTAVAETMPFGDGALVYKLGLGIEGFKGKMFALISINASPLRINLKCDPEKSVTLRDEYPDHILPGYHMNKKHWNTIVCTYPLTPEIATGLIDHSYDLVYRSLPRKVRGMIEENS